MKILLLPLILLISLVVFTNPATPTETTTNTTVSDHVVKLDSLEEQVKSLQNEKEALKIELDEVQSAVSESRSLDASVVQALNNISVKLSDNNDGWMLGTNILLAAIALGSFLASFFFYSKDKRFREIQDSPDLELSFEKYTATISYQNLNTGFYETDDLLFPDSITIRNNGNTPAKMKVCKIFMIGKEYDIPFYGKILQGLSEENEKLPIKLSEEIVRKFNELNSEYQALMKFIDGNAIKIKIEYTSRYKENNTRVFQYNCILNNESLEIVQKD